MYPQLALEFLGCLLFRGPRPTTCHPIGTRSSLQLLAIASLLGVVACGVLRQETRAQTLLACEGQVPTPLALQPLRRLPPIGPVEVQPIAFFQAVEPRALADTALPLLPILPAESGLTLEQLEPLALTNNPSLAEARAWVTSARGKWIQSGLAPNTVLGYSGQQLGSHGEAEQHGLFVAQEFVRGGKLRLNQAIASQEIRKAQQRWTAQRQRVLTDVRLAYYDGLVAQLRTDTAAELVQTAQETVDTAHALLVAQEVSQVDVMRARIELQTAQLVLKNAANLHTAVWSRLLAVVGVEDLPQQPLLGNVECIQEAVKPDKVLARMLRESPEMAAALSDVKRARWAVARACAEPIANVDLSAILQNDNSTGSNNASLQVTVPIPWLDRNQGAIRQARAELVAAKRAVDKLKLSFQQRLANVYQRYANAHNQVKDYSQEAGILFNSKMTLDFTRKGYEAGELSYIDLLTAQRTFSQTNLDYIEALGELWAALVEIEGLLLKDSLANNTLPK